jgi:hypothetical protein
MGSGDSLTACPTRREHYVSGRTDGRETSKLPARPIAIMNDESLRRPEEDHWSELDSSLARRPKLRVRSRYSKRGRASYTSKYE